MVYLDLDEFDSLSSGLIASRAFAVRSFLRRDHEFDSARPLADEVREFVARETGVTPTGPIRLLTQLRYFGYYMSPLNLYYCFDDSGEHVQTIVAEVSNTPWNERHCYVLAANNRIGESGLRFRHAKAFHVSPFMDMQMEYKWRLGEPGKRLNVGLTNIENSKPLFSAAMSLDRRPLTKSNLRRMTLRYPIMSARIVSAIYFQALKLWWKQCPYYPHPRSAKSNPETSTSPEAQRVASTISRQ